MRWGERLNRTTWAVLLVLGLVGPDAAQELPPVGAGDPAAPLKPSPVAADVHDGAAVPLPLECHCDSSPAKLFADLEYLYLKPRRDYLDFAIVAPASNIANGSIESLNYDWRSAFRVGGGYCLGEGWEAGVYYSYLHSNASQSLVKPTDGGTIFPTLTHPGFINSVDTASATSGFNYNVLDAELGRRFAINDSALVRLFAGGRFAWIRQSLDAYYDGGDANMAHVSSPIGFHGGGFRVGGEGTYLMPWGFGLFARASGSLLLGDFHTSLLETNNNETTVNVNVSRGFEKIVPVADIALGVSWQYRNLTVSGGYELVNWFGLVDSPNFTDDVSQGKLSRRNGDLSLDGFFIRVAFAY
jgi:hypothetical protein